MKAFLPMLLMASLASASDKNYGELLDYQVVHPVLGALPNEPAFFAIRSSEDWEARHAGATDKTVSQQGASKIDFEHYTLIVASNGWKAVSGNVMAILAVFESPASMNVWIQESTFIGTCAILSIPFAAALIPKTVKPIVFHISKAQSECASLKTSTDRAAAN